MFNKNLKYYRLKNGLTKKSLAIAAGVTPMAISNYENGNRVPQMDIMKRLAEALHIRVTDFLTSRNDNLVFCHNEFRKGASLGQEKQELVRETAEEYFNRYMTIIEILGDGALPASPAIHSLQITGNVEVDALALRGELNFSSEGPIGELISQLENKGFLIYACEINEDKFSGINGTVNGRPYIMYNSYMSAVRTRSTVIHELAHIMFNWDLVAMDEKEIEKYATGIAGAFLLPEEDLKRELGLRRSYLSYDMVSVSSEYGVSIMMLLKRANLCGILNESAYYRCCLNASQRGWRKHDPARVSETGPLMFSQFVYRAIAEEEISVQKGAELLQVPYQTVASNCYYSEV